MKTVQKLTLDDARVIMAGAEAKAREIGVDMDIAITDDNGSLLMFQRMDNGRITSIDVAIWRRRGDVARKLMAPLENRYAEALVYVYAAGEGEGAHVLATRFQWTASGGLVVVEY